MPEPYNDDTAEVCSSANSRLSAACRWFVYLIRTEQGVLYTGISTDPARRLRQHQGKIGGGAKALRGKGQLHLVWQTQAPNRSIASQWEYQLKKLPKKAKEQLVSLCWQPDFLRSAGDDTAAPTPAIQPTTEVA